MVAELYPEKAPVTVANFLHYVDAGYFTNGQFFRTVTMDNQPNDKVKIEGDPGGGRSQPNEQSV